MALSYKAPSDKEFNNLVASHGVKPGSDADLPANQKRNRGAAVADKLGVVFAPGDVALAKDMGEVRVLGHGRGIGWVLVCWKDGTNLCVGTFPVSALTKK